MCTSACNFEPESFLGLAVVAVVCPLAECRPDLEQRLLGGLLYLLGRSDHNKSDSVCYERFCPTLTGRYRSRRPTSREW